MGHFTLLGEEGTAGPRALDLRERVVRR